MPAYFLSVVLIWLLAACGGNDSAAETRSATVIIAAFKARGLPIVASVDYTAANDPEKLLGRPGQYRSKSTFHDGRIFAIDLFGTDTQAGGTVEVFAAKEEAARRRAYLESLGKLAPFLLEYVFQDGTVVLRLSRSLTPDQAEAYRSVLRMRP